jgi:outer membrane receptor protein involved in Fe transport
MMHRKLKSVSAFLLFAASVLVGEAVLQAGTTGKISGVVLDAVTKQPLVGANVIVTGAGFGAAADLEGSYAILNVPPGTYTVRFTMMGYKQTFIENARVSIDMTTVLDGLLSPTVLNSNEVVTIQAERPLVKKDMTSSLVSVSSEEIGNLPVSEVSEVLALQAGVVRSDGLHIRGGRSNEIAYWVDGVSATNVFSGTMGVTVENAAVKELQVISGTFNAEYGQAMSGIVNIITKEGGEKYTGQARAYVGDYVSSGDKFGVLKSVRTVTNASTGKSAAAGAEENPLAKFNPITDGEFNLSGPVPGFGGKFTFFTNARYFSNEGYLYGRDWFKPTGVPGDSDLVPMSPYQRGNVQLKLKVQVSPRLKFTHNVFWSHDGQDRIYSRLYKYNPYGTARHFNDGLTQIFTINHVLSEKTFYEIKLSRFDNTYKQYVYRDPNAKPDYLVQMTDAWGNAVTFDPNTDAGRARLDSLVYNRANYSYIVDPDGPEGYIHHDLDEAPATYSFLNDGMDRDHIRQSTGYWLGKLDLTSQVNRIHQLKAGLEMRLYRLFFEQVTLRPKLKTDADEEIVPYEPEIKPLSSMYHWKYDRKPKEFSAYVQDKIELKDLIVNLGLRFDYFNSEGVVPTDPSDPNIYYPFKDEHIYRNPNAPDSLKEEYSPEERRAFMQKKAGSKTQVSPRLGIAYPVTDRGVIHFSYGHFFQIPTFNYLYDRPEFKIDPSTTNVIMGNADLKPQRTVQYEIGLQQQISDNIGIDLTMFYRDVRDWVSTSAMIVTPLPGVEYAKWENKDYSNVRGVTVGLTKRFSSHFSSELDYYYQVAEGTYSNPSDAFLALVGNQEPRLKLIPMSWDQTHTLNGSFSWVQGGWTVSTIASYYTGRPYTPTVAKASTVGSASAIEFADNSRRMPSRKNVDLLVRRTFPFRTMQVSLFANVYNLFDIENQNAVWSDTGTADYTTTIEPSAIPYDANRIGTIADYSRISGYYAEPRRIEIGMAVGF